MRSRITSATCRDELYEIVTDLEKENARLRKALEFYAVYENYLQKWVGCNGDRCPGRKFEDSVMDADQGKRAREALNPKESQE